MNRRRFLAVAAGCVLAPTLVSSAQAAPAALPASEILNGAERYLGIPYRYGGVNPATGLDCSAYVSLIWRIPRQTTDTIHYWSSEIAKDELLPGDALNWGFVGRLSHMRLFAGWATEDRSIAWMYEAARGRGVAYRVVGYDSRYTPIRRFNVEPDVRLPAPYLPLDYDVPNGHFFSQAGDRDGKLGFTISDVDGARLWTEYRKLGGMDKLGTPLTRRFDSHGRIVQIMQNGVLHWDANEKFAYFGSFPPNFSTAAPAEAREPERSPYLPKA